MEFLRTQGKYIVNESGQKVFLRGVCFGGWLNMENFISGYPGAESTLRQAIRAELGEERYQAFFQSFLDTFITEDDFRFLKELGATVVRVPFNYRHFEDDQRPGEYKDEGFVYLDRVVGWAKKYGIYVILDLHAAPGWQNQGWHSDNPYGVALLWEHRQFQERGRDLWVHIARHYRDEPAVAGYNLLNEPNAPSMADLNRLYREWVQAIRAVDDRHILFLEGNDYSRVFDGLDEPWDDNLVYSSHNYTLPTHRARTYPGQVAGVYADRAYMERVFLETNRWILERQLPSWVGEFGALFDGPVHEPTGADLARLRALRDQLAIFNEYEQHWTIWTYKDVGVQGLRVCRADSEYMRRIRPILEAKGRLGLDAWTSRDGGRLMVQMRAILEMMVAELGDFSLDTGALAKALGERAVYGLLACALAPLYAALFQDMSAGEVAAMHREAFLFPNTEERSYLVEVLRDALKP
ncbi:MAG: glycoside hydrolase family 5 protein [Bacillota bacterium]